MPVLKPIVVLVPLLLSGLPCPTVPAVPTAAACVHTVPAGLVHWHPDFAAACAAARTSNKPVLLFHLLGRLDEEFC